MDLPDRESHRREVLASPDQTSPETVTLSSGEPGLELDKHLALQAYAFL